MKRLFLFISVFSISVFASAQQKKQNPRQLEKEEKRQDRRQKIDNLIRQQEEGALVFNKQNVFGIRLNTDGWGMFFEKGYMKSPKVANLFAIEFSEKKHPKEKKLSYGVSNGPFLQFSTPYVYGKQNIFYQLKPSFGQQRMIGGKANKNGVSVHAIYAGGISLGIERPYYITVAVSQNETKNLKYSLTDSAAFLSPGNIIQGTGFRYGWKDMKLVPGVHAKLAVRFDYGRFNEMVSAIEIGVNAEAYSRDINQMVNVQGFISPNRTFFNSYVAILFGKRK